MQINGDVERIAAQAADADRAVIRLIASIMDRSDHVAAQTGVPVEVWLASVTRLLPLERRRLLAAAETLPKMPGVWNAFQDGLLSWSQVCAVLNMGRSLRAGDRTVYDDRLAVAAVELADADAGALLDIADMVVKQLDHARQATAEKADVDRDICCSSHVSIGLVGRSGVISPPRRSPPSPTRSSQPHHRPMWSPTLTPTRT